MRVGPPAAGGACVARHEGRVVFVRHALPGELVRAVITEDRDRFLRADAVDVLEASPDRVPQPCPYARPGRCGGCDWQHATGAAQRRMKAEVIREQFARLGGIEIDDLVVEELPGGLLGWRTRITYAVDGAGRPGLHRHRSRDLEYVDHCPLGVPAVGRTDALRREWPGLSGIEAVADDGGETVALLAHRPGAGRHSRGRRPPDRVQVISGPPAVTRHLRHRRYEVSANGFWQVHPAAGEAFAATLLRSLEPRAGERVLDLYAGAGAFTALLADAVGPAGRVLGFESAAGAVADAGSNLADLPQARVERARVDAGLLAGLDPVDLVVLDPPRAGAGPEVVRAILSLRPRAVGYVSCDPATLARDVAAATAAGWRLAELRAFDAFPMTHHVECVATLRPPDGATAP